MATWGEFGPRYEELEGRPLTAGNVQAWLHDWSDLDKDVLEAYTRLMRVRDENTRSEEAGKAFLSFVQEVLPKAQVAAQNLTQRLLEVEFEPPLDQLELLRRSRNEADLFREENVPIKTELETLNSEFQEIMGGLMVTLDGEKMTIPQAEKHLLDTNRARREAAWRAIEAAEATAREGLDDLFLRMLPLRRRLAENAGETNYRAYRWREMNRFAYAPKDAERLHDATAYNVVPLLADWRERRREALGVSSLRPWDLGVDLYGEEALEPFQNTDELEAGLVRIFNRLDPAFGEQFESLRDGWLELESREGKVPGLGYQTFFPKQRKPYIYWSANGTHRDVWVLLHEGGHAFHSLASSARNDLLWDLLPGMEVAEVASQTMELLTLPYLEASQGGFYNEHDAKRAQRENLERALRQLPGQAQADAFQHWLYTAAPENMTAEDLDDKWLELSARFDPAIDWSGLEEAHAKGWQFGHVFQAPFYMLEYSFAWLGAIQIWKRAQQDPSGALESYKAALALGGTRPLEELYDTAGIRLVFGRDEVGALMKEVHGALVGTLE